jgi:predicted RNase H-like nuclease (RuvC/YqgF family)
MSGWIIGLIVTAAVTAVVTGVLKFWGRGIVLALRSSYTAVSLGAMLERNRIAEQEYRDTITATIEALKEKIELLEKWREEARVLEVRVAELEEHVDQLRKDSAAKSEEISRAEMALAEAKKKLAERDTSIFSLQEQLEVQKEKVAALKIELAERKAVIADNQLKIAALLHASGGDDDV